MSECCSNCTDSIGTDGKCRDCGAYYAERDKSLQPMTREEAEAAIADVGNVLPMTDSEVESVVNYVMTRARAKDN